MSEPSGAGAKLLTERAEGDRSPTIPDIELFLLESPLYAPHPVERNDVEVKRMLYAPDLKVDGFCPYCHDRTTFSRTSGSTYTQNPTQPVRTLNQFASVRFKCARDGDHIVTIWAYVDGPNDQIQKVGQYPSLADVANDQAKQFRKVLKPRDANELHKAIGLAAHGVGIGSFVYLRRVFERLIKFRFDEHKAAENWTEEDWTGRRMDERIRLMKDYLPEFLVANSSVYSILSKGIHELDDDTCLTVFEIVKESIVEILEEDERKRQKEQRQKNLTKSLQQITAKL
jgi:hypothetical protein